MGLVLFARFHELPQAQVVASALESAGLTPLVFDRHYGGVDWVAQSALGGYRLMLPEEEAADARAVLADLASQPADPEDQPTAVPPGGPIRAVLALGSSLFGLGELGWLVSRFFRQPTLPGPWTVLLGGLTVLALFALGAGAAIAVTIFFTDPP